jgi:hypothetical protein
MSDDLMNDKSRPMPAAREGVSQEDSLVQHYADHIAETWRLIEAGFGHVDRDQLGKGGCVGFPCHGGTLDPGVEAFLDEAGKLPLADITRIWLLKEALELLIVSSDMGRTPSAELLALVQQIPTMRVSELRLRTMRHMRFRYPLATAVYDGALLVDERHWDECLRRGADGDVVEDDVA